MSGSLTHSPADVLRRLLIDLSFGADPTGLSTDTWPIYVSKIPAQPDSCILIVDTTPVRHGRLMPTGEVQEQHGVQITVRDPGFAAGWTKARAVAVALDETVKLNTVTISSSVYAVYAVVRVNGPLAIGQEAGISKRELFTINALVNLRQTT